jgi:hypothetical protein
MASVATVFVTALRPNPLLSLGRELLTKYPVSKFDLVNTAEESQIILYLEKGYVGLADLPKLLTCLRAAPAATHLLFSESDWPFPVLPGAYPSLSRPLPWAYSWSFLPAGAEEDEQSDSSEDAEPEFLFSFLGRIRTHPVRKKLLLLDESNTPCLDVEDAPKRFSSFDYLKTYRALIKRSKFVLCPRGFGASSIRIFETMALGRAPVVISDQWQPPPGIRWDEFCIRIPESEVRGIPATLRGLTSEAPSMGQRARDAYKRHFAPDCFFDRLLSTLLSSRAAGPGHIAWRSWQALGWREVRTLCHQARSGTFALFSKH